MRRNIKVDIKQQKKTTLHLNEEIMSQEDNGLKFFKAIERKKCECDILQSIKVYFKIKATLVKQSGPKG